MTSQERITWPAWMDTLSEHAGQAAREALRERDAAVEGGADRCRSCQLALRRADRKLDLVGRLKGRDVDALLARLLRRYGKLSQHTHR